MVSGRGSGLYPKDSIYFPHELGYELPSAVRNYFLQESVIGIDMFQENSCSSLGSEFLLGGMDNDGLSKVILNDKDHVVSGGV